MSDKPEKPDGPKLVGMLIGGIVEKFLRDPQGSIDAVKRALHRSALCTACNHPRWMHEADDGAMHECRFEDGCSCNAFTEVPMLWPRPELGECFEPFNVTNQQCRHYSCAEIRKKGGLFK